MEISFHLNSWVVSEMYPRNVFSLRMRESIPINEGERDGMCYARSRSSAMSQHHVSLWAFGSYPGNHHTMEKWNFQCKRLAGEWYVDVAPALFLFVGKRKNKEHKIDQWDSDLSFKESVIQNLLWQEHSRPSFWGWSNHKSCSVALL